MSAARWVDRWEDVPGGAEAWDTLLRRSGATSPFLTWSWQRAWWEVHGGGHRPWLLVGTGGEGLAVPLARLRSGWPRTVRFSGGGTGDAHGLEPLVAGDRREAASILLGALEARSGWDVLELAPMVAEGSWARELRTELDARGWRSEEHRWTRRVLVLPGDADDILARLSSRSRDRIAYATRRMQRERGVELRRATTIPEVRSTLRALEAMERRRAGSLARPSYFAAGSTRELLGTVAERFQREGRLDLWWLHSDGIPVAVHLGFRTGTVHTFLIASFEPALERYSPGTVMLHLLARALVQEGVAEIDLLGGDEAYKVRWRAQERAYLRVRAARPGTPGAGWLAANAAAARLRRRMPKGLTHLLGRLRRLLPADDQVPIENR
jgi:CelD/BcsL family acetyltransferase involved in cellulose biosynthesis